MASSTTAAPAALNVVPALSDPNDDNSGDDNAERDAGAPSSRCASGQQAAQMSSANHHGRETSQNTNCGEKADATELVEGAEDLELADDVTEITHGTEGTVGAKSAGAVKGGGDDKCGDDYKACDAAEASAGVTIPRGYGLWKAEAHDEGWGPYYRNHYDRNSIGAVAEVASGSLLGVIFDALVRIMWVMLTPFSTRHWPYRRLLFNDGATEKHPVYEKPLCQAHTRDPKTGQPHAHKTHDGSHLRDHYIAAECMTG